MAENQKAGPDDERGAQRDDHENTDARGDRRGQRSREGNRDMTFAQGGEGDQQQGNDTKGPNH